jgi:hypothetical protein
VVPFTVDGAVVDGTPVPNWFTVDGAADWVVVVNCEL